MNRNSGFFEDPSSKLFNTSTSHPLIPNANDYIIYKKYVSIHSEDRDVLKYPNSNQFEIEMPEDITNVYSLRLINWTFPSNYNSFSISNSNVTMFFKITNPYNPGENLLINPLEQAIFECLFYSANKLFEFTIQEGFYNPTQMVTELQNKFNFVVTKRITAYFKEKSVTDPDYLNLLTQFNEQGGYTKFVIVYNVVGQKIWFGNTTDEFMLVNEEVLLMGGTDTLFCAQKTQQPEFDFWGLPGNLGLSRCNTTAISINTSDSGEPFTPRFFYGDVNPGDNGIWLTPNTELPGSVVYFIEPSYKINLMGPAYFYMELAGNNCIDETSPYTVNKFTLSTNITNGVTNSAFAKISIPTTPISQWFDRESLPYKMYWPPADRIRKLSIKLRYHNGQLVNFGAFPYSFTIEFTQLQSQQNRRFTQLNKDVK
jgi:hypothetical protein